MKKNQEDNTVSVIQRAIKSFGINITNDTIKVSLKSSPFYPSLRCITDAFSEWNIEHYPIKYSTDEIKNIKSPYIAHLNINGGEIAFVIGHKNGDVILYYSFNKKEKIPWNEYIKQISGAVILLNPDEKSGESNFFVKKQSDFLKRAIVPASISALALIIIVLVSNSLVSTGLIVPGLFYILLGSKLLGIIISALLFMKENEIQVPLAEKLCKLNEYVNCNAVLNDKASIVYGSIGWADVGIIYFTGSMLILLQGWSGFLTIASALALPYTFFSIWYQAVRLKRLCPFCLIIQFILIVEFILQIFYNSVLNLSLSLLTEFLFTFFIVGIFQISINQLIKLSREKKLLDLKLARLKKNPEIIKTLIFNQKQFNIPVTENSLILGQNNSRLHITAFLSLECSHCARAFFKLNDILKSDYNAQVNIILLGEETKIINTIYHLFKIGKNEDVIAILNKWYKSDNISRHGFLNDYCPINSDESNQISSENLEIMKTCEVSGTPTVFIDGFRLPVQYDIDDLKYISNLIK
ncbi:MAG: vitamin K epoxide reductase family protein [Methanococcaceae archaeon]